MSRTRPKPYLWLPPLILMILATLTVHALFGEVQLSPADREESIARGLKAIPHLQLSYGEFKMTVCMSRSGKTWCGTDSTPLINALSLLALAPYKHDPRFEDTAHKAVSFLLSEETTSSVWRTDTRFSTARNLRSDIVDQRNGKVLIDFDTTALVSEAVSVYTGQSPDNLQSFDRQRTPDGLYYVWQAQPDGTQNPEVDCGTVTNIASYLSTRQALDNPNRICQYLKDVKENGKSCSIYYDPHSLVIDYLIGRAYENGLTCVSDMREFLIKDIMSHRKGDYSFGDELETAMAVSTLVRLNAQTPDLEKSLVWLVKKQGGDGFWPWQPIYYFRGKLDTLNLYGSPVLTTAFAIEALTLSR